MDASEAMISELLLMAKTLTLTLMTCTILVVLVVVCSTSKKYVCRRE